MSQSQAGQFVYCGTSGHSDLNGMCFSFILVGFVIFFKESGQLCLIVLVIFATSPPLYFDICQYNYTLQTMEQKKLQPDQSTPNTIMSKKVYSNQSQYKEVKSKVMQYNIIQSDVIKCIVGNRTWSPSQTNISEK